MSGSSFTLHCSPYVPFYYAENLYGHALYAPDTGGPQSNGDAGAAQRLWYRCGRIHRGGFQSLFALYEAENLGELSAPGGSHHLLAESQSLSHGLFAHALHLKDQRPGGLYSEGHEDKIWPSAWPCLFR